MQVIEPDENLSDKEIYPSSQLTGHRQVGQIGVGGIPSIGMYGDNQQLQNTRSNLRNTIPEITKEVSSDANLSEDDYHDPRRGRMQQGQQHYQVSYSCSILIFFP